jgi:hypothetical protein
MIKKPTPTAWRSLVYSDWSAVESLLASYQPGGGSGGRKAGGKRTLLAPLEELDALLDELARGLEKVLNLIIHFV